MHFAFVKYHGAGNDFIVIDDRTLFFPIDDISLIAQLCHRKFGIGADGLLLIQPSSQADVALRIFNADGKEALMCGNGLRCVVHFLGEKQIKIATPQKVVTASIKDHKFTIDMGQFQWLKGMRWNENDVHLIDTGVPHAIVFVNDLERLDFIKAAREIRFHPDLHPGGANVNFATLKEGKIYIRTYERGVEDETLACGTGSAAVAIAASKIYALPSPISCITASKELLEVEIEKESVRLSGPAKPVFCGTINI